jgi:anti-sigma factor RsiW
MNCEEYRQTLAADPSFDGGAAHLSECSACREYRAEILALDVELGRALRLDVPALTMPELPDVEPTNVVPLHGRRLAGPTGWFAVAATVLVAAILGIRLVGSDVEYSSLAEEVLAHLDHEPYALQVTDQAVSDRRLYSVVTPDIASMDRSAGLISYAQTCVINGRKVPHLVLQGERGPVTILLMPDERVQGATALEGEQVNGVILPVGNGSIAIIGEREERIDNLQQRILKSVTWTT